MYYVYAIQSTKDKNLYIGHTDNLVKRFREHNTGLVESTRSRKHFQLVYYEACNILNDAIRIKKCTINSICAINLLITNGS